MKILKASFKGKSISKIATEYPEGLVTAREIYRIVVEDTKLYVVWTDRDTGELEAEWKVFDGVYTVAHIDDAVFEDGKQFRCKNERRLFDDTRKIQYKICGCRGTRTAETYR